MQLREAHEHAEAMATHDFLTGLPNWVLLEDRIQRSTALSIRQRKLGRTNLHTIRRDELLIARRQIANGLLPLHGSCRRDRLQTPKRTTDTGAETGTAEPRLLIARIATAICKKSNRQQRIGGLAQASREHIFTTNGPGIGDFDSRARFLLSLMPGVRPSYEFTSEER